MKIYYVANAKIPSEKAHGIQLAKMCEAFVEQGVDLELVAPFRKSPPQSLREFYGLSCHVPVKKLPVLDIYSWGRWGFVIASFSFMLSSYFYLWKKTRKEQGIIYTTDLDQFSFSLIPLAGVSYFAEIHDAKPRRISFSFFFKHAKGIAVVNELIKKEIIRVYGVPEDKILVHPNGIDLRQFGGSIEREAAREKLGLLKDVKIAMYLGKFYPWKGLEVLPSAAEEEQDALFYLVGGTREEFIKVTGKSILPPNLIFVGGRPYKEMPFWLAAADVFLALGTRNNKYSYAHTSPMKLFEYMASKRPIVASRTSANRQIVSEDEVIFYEPDNFSDLAEKIQYVLEHSDKLYSKIENAYRKVQSFSWDKRAESILKFLTKQTF